MKICTKCKIEKQLIYFHKNKKSKDKLSTICRSCKQLYKQQNKEIIKIKHKQYREKLKEIIKISAKNYRIKNRDKINENGKIFRQTEKCKQYRRLYFKQRLQKDINFKITRNIRARINHALLGNYKKGSAVTDLGCSIEEFKKYLESKFQPGMSFNNYGKNGWEIDHIFPLSKLDLTNRDIFLKAVHYTNMQPLWAKDNLKKGNKIL